LLTSLRRRVGLVEPVDDDGSQTSRDEEHDPTRKKGHDFVEFGHACGKVVRNPFIAATRTKGRLPWLGVFPVFVNEESSESVFSKS